MLAQRTPKIALIWELLRSKDAKPYLEFTIFLKEFEDASKIIPVFEDLPNVKTVGGQFPPIFSRLDKLGFTYKLKILGKWYSISRILTKIILKSAVKYYNKYGEDKFLKIWGEYNGK